MSNSIPRLDTYTFYWKTKKDAFLVSIVYKKWFNFEIVGDKWFTLYLCTWTGTGVQITSVFSYPWYQASKTLILSVVLIGVEICKQSLLFLGCSQQIQDRVSWGPCAQIQRKIYSLVGQLSKLSGSGRSAQYPSDFQSYSQARAAQPQAQGTSVLKMPPFFVVCFVL